MSQRLLTLTTHSCCVRACAHERRERSKPRQHFDQGLSLSAALPEVAEFKLAGELDDAIEEVAVQLVHHLDVSLRSEAFLGLQ